MTTVKHTSQWVGTSDIPVVITGLRTTVILLNATYLSLETSTIVPFTGRVTDSVPCDLADSAAIVGGTVCVGTRVDWMVENWVSHSTVRIASNRTKCNRKD